MAHHSLGVMRTEGTQAASPNSRGSKGNFVIAFVDGEFTIKQFKMDESGTFGWLIPWNSEFSPIRVDETNRFMVWGVVTYVIHQIAE